MNVVGKIGLTLVAGLVLGLTTTQVHSSPAPVTNPAPVVPKTDPDDPNTAPDTAPDAGPANDSSQPYGTIVARNIFGLVPIPPPAPDTPATPVDPPPKITANGITSILGQLQALFKVTPPAKPGQQAKEISYMLSEGQRQDDIEVVKIDEKSATISFINHGVPQDIPLTDAGASTGPAPAAGGGPGQPQNPFAPKTPRFGERPGGFAAIGAGGQGSAAPQFGMNNNNNSSLNGGGGGSAPYGAGSANNLTPEESAILLEAERARLETSANPEYPPSLLPPPPGPGRSTGVPK